MTKEKQSTSISLLCFNTFGTIFFAPHIGARYKKVAELLNKNGPDILCFQEVATYYQLGLLKKHLSNYPYVVYKKFVFGPKGGLVIFSKLPVESKRYDSFASLGALTMYTQLLRNGILSCKLKEYPVRILNTHLISDFEYDSTRPNRYSFFVLKQLQEAGVLMQVFAEAGDTVITAGDFNLAKTDHKYTEFIKKFSVHDVFVKADEPTYIHDRYSWKFMASRSVRIDYIFLLDKYDRIHITSTEHAFTKKVQLTTIKNGYLSDHIALVAKFSIKR